MILHLLHIFLTDALTFIVSNSLSSTGLIDLETDIAGFHHPAYLDR